MKTFVSYVIQENDKHRHLSDIIDVNIPPYSFSPDPPVSGVMEWAKNKQASLRSNQRLILVNIFKI